MSHGAKVSGLEEGKSSVTRRRRRRGGKDASAKLKRKIEIAIQNEDFYLANQLILSQYHRLKSSDITEGLSGLFNGARDLLKAGQGNEGGSLACTYIQEGIDHKITPLAKDIVRIQSLFDMFGKADVKPRVEMMKLAIQWTSKCGSNPHGDQRLHTQLARFYDQHCLYAEAHKHYVRGARPQDHARCVMNWAKEGTYPEEIELFVARGVLEYLCIKGNLKNASAFYSSCVKFLDEIQPYKDQITKARKEAARCDEEDDENSSNHHHTTASPSSPSSSTTTTTSLQDFLRTDNRQDLFEAEAAVRPPLINFLGFLLTSIERRALSLFDMLCDKYEISLLQDPAYDKYLHRIAQIYFGRQAPKGILEELLGLFS
mmetsp:Transcript_16646/g.27053  ORF Transcript_16646/g.27053 Transcript_16646/m.27053 type:complete len:372 (-) Transcript_16646:275-1390(-)